MKKYLLPVLVLIVAVVQFHACSEKEGGSSGKEGFFEQGTVLSHADKGWEMYSWEHDGSQWFSLMTGTNRVKNYDEVVEGPVTVRGMDNLVLALDALPEGEMITLLGPRWLQNAWGGGYNNLGLPPAAMIAEIESFCLTAGLEFGVAE